MNFEKLNAWLGLLGQLAVLGGLVALAIEIRGNNLAIQQQENASLMEQDSDRTLMLLDPQARASYTKALFAPETLTIDDVFGASIYLNLRVTQIGSAYTSFREGTLSEDQWQSLLSRAPLYLGTDFGKKWWAFSKADFEGDVDLVRQIDATLQETSAVPDDRYYQELCAFLELPAC